MKNLRDCKGVGRRDGDKNRMKVQLVVRVWGFAGAWGGNQPGWADREVSLSKHTGPCVQ